MCGLFALFKWGPSKQTLTTMWEFSFTNCPGCRWFSSQVQCSVAVCVPTAADTVLLHSTRDSLAISSIQGTTGVQHTLHNGVASNSSFGKRNEWVSESRIKALHNKKYDVLRSAIREFSKPRSHMKLHVQDAHFCISNHIKCLSKYFPGVGFFFLRPALSQASYGETNSLLSWSKYDKLFKMANLDTLYEQI
jgi:hypothetical protein